MEYQNSVIELIKQRTSTRSFEKRDIESTKLQALREFVAHINQGTTKCRFFITNHPGGTYSVISGASSYIVGALYKDRSDTLTFGYLFEKIVLFATDLGLQTCWLGGSFKRSDFEKISNLTENEFIPIVSPVGYKTEKRKALDKAMRAIAGSDFRKPWSDLFFEDTIAYPLSEAHAGTYAVPLEMVRLAPSASNKQPWRIIMDKKVFHFFLCRTKAYGLQSYDLQKNDIGIAMCHFELSANELGLEGTWSETKYTNKPNQWEYITSWYIQ